MRIILLLFIVPFLGHGQYLQRLTVQTGISYPTEPVAFYDYWKSGPGFAVGYSRQYDDGKGFLVSAEYNAFLFDTPAFMNRLNITDPKADITGATTSIMNIYAAVMYILPDMLGVELQPFIGGGASVIRRTAAEARYSFSTRTASSETAILFCVPMGIQTSIAISEELDLLLECKRMYGLSREKDKNSDFVSLRAGISYVY